MPRELHHRNGKVEFVPNPLETSPVLRLLGRHRGKTYNIYVDESMRSFLTSINGYLCCAAVGIPEGEYEFVKRAMRPIFNEYERMVTGDPDVHLEESSSIDFDTFLRSSELFWPRRERRSSKLTGALSWVFTQKCAAW